MKSTKKRLFKTIAVTLSAVMLSYTTLPAAAAYAAPPPPPPHGHHGMHHHHDTKMSTAAAVIGVALTIGLVAWMKNNAKPKIPTDPKGYAMYRNDFVDTLTAQERAVYDEMINCQTGEYKYAYTNQETARTIKKLCKKLPRDFKYSGATSVKEADGTKTKYIIFQRLEADSFGSIQATATSGTLAEAM